MSFTPEDIANRVFTPSAEGYHQGEVRDFLQRVAREVRQLQAAGTAQISGTSSATHADAVSATDDDRLAAVSDRLESLVGQLERVIATNDSQGRPPTSSIAASTPPVAASNLPAPPPPSTHSASDRVTVVVEEPDRPVGSTAGSRPSSSAPLPRVPADKLTAPLDPLLPTSPTFTDSANDLLDGVLDDVMGTLDND